jgi:hypothetical protein
MPAIYRIEDSRESKRAGLDASVAAAVTFDGRKTGSLMPGEYQALLLGNEIEPLPHPLERSSLRGHGHTYLSASLKGVLLKVERRICLQCGHIFDAPQIVFAIAAGCLPALLVSLTTFALLRFTFHLTVGFSALAAWAALMLGVLVVQFAGTAYIRLRFSERQSSIAKSRCPSCDGDNSVSVASVAGKRVPVGAEGDWLQVSIAGKS